LLRKQLVVIIEENKQKTKEVRIKKDCANCVSIAVREKNFKNELRKLRISL